MSTDFLEISGQRIKRTAMLAPMASVADRAYRYMCKKYGAVMVVGEMASAKGLCYSDKKTRELLEVTAYEQPMGIQLFGSEPDFFAKACKIANEYRPQFIDINMGCPVHKVIATGSGSALMKTPKLACDIVKACVDAVDIPITAKIRTGYDENSINATEMAQMLEEAGISAIAVHGRTKKQMYTPPVDTNIIAKVKKTVSIPVIANGDITSPELAKQMYEQTGCDLVMIGRGSYGMPWIFEDVEHYFENGTVLPKRCLDYRLNVMQEHIALICKFKGERLGMREARKHAAWYLKGVNNAAKFRNLCGKLSSFDDLQQLIVAVKADNS